jgi:hypothetical protein
VTRIGIVGLLAAAAIAAVVAPARPAVAKPPGRTAEVIECSSKQGGHRYCPTYAIGSVRLVEQLSKSPCRLYDTWGADGDGSGIWVRDGCRARFVVERGRGRRPIAPGPRRLTCKSPDWSYRHCGVPTWGRRIRVEKQLSRTRCVRGDNWGVDSSGIWVDRGCAAVFGVA